MTTRFILEGSEAGLVIIPETKIDKKVLKLIEDGGLENPTVEIERSTYGGNVNSLTITFKTLEEHEDTIPGELQS